MIYLKELILFLYGREVLDNFCTFLNYKDVRIGQAFFNALPNEDQERLRGSKYDTFYFGQPIHEDPYPGVYKILEALDFLTSK